MNDRCFLYILLGSEYDSRRGIQELQLRWANPMLSKQNMTSTHPYGFRNATTIRVNTHLLNEGVMMASAISSSHYQISGLRSVKNKTVKTGGFALLKYLTALSAYGLSYTRLWNNAKYLTISVGYWGIFAIRWANTPFASRSVGGFPIPVVSLQISSRVRFF